MNRNEWNSSAAGLRLATLLAAAVLLFTAYAAASGAGAVTQLQGIAVALASYAAGVALAAWVPFLHRDARRQAAILSALMIALVVAATVLTGARYMAVLLWLPALLGVLRLGSRGMLLSSISCGLLWLVLRNLQNINDFGAWSISILSLLPALLILGVMRGLSGEVADTRNRITALSYRDELTGLLNMRAFTRMLQGQHRKAADEGTRYALLMIDIDHLQVFNDRFGHEQGNRVIVAVADAIKRSTRGDDLIARYGGDEFVVLLPGAGDDVAEVVMNRIAQNVYNITLSFDRSMQRVGVNTGRAIYPDSGASIQEMMSFADRAMYRDKEFRRSVQDRKADISQLKAQAGVEDWS